MSSTSQQKSSIISTLLSAQTLVIIGIGWAVLALLFFLLFSITPSGELPLWYSIGTYIFELGAFLIAALVCYRNWQSPQMVSGRNVWLGIGLGTFFYFLGGVLFGLWELVWALDPAVSFADVFYILSYLMLGWGMITAVTSKRLNLEVWQWTTLAGVAIAGITLATWVADPSFFGLLGPSEPLPAEEQVVTAPAETAQTAPAVQGAESSQEAEEEAIETTAPSWVVEIDQRLEPLAFWVNLFYIYGDVVLLILATALILAFWGGRFSQSWRMIAFAIFSLYIADTYFKWADSRVQSDYESGGLLEVFFVFTGILFAIGAILEYDISTRSRQSRRSRRSSARS